MKISQRTVEYDDAGDLKTIYTLPPTSSDFPSVLAFSLPKAGSVLLDSIMQSYLPLWGSPM